MHYTREILESSELIKKTPTPTRVLLTSKGEEANREP